MILGLTMGNDYDRPLEFVLRPRPDIAPAERAALAPLRGRPLPAIDYYRMGSEARHLPVGPALREGTRGGGIEGRTAGETEREKDMPSDLLTAEPAVVNCVAPQTVPPGRVVDGTFKAVVRPTCGFDGYRFHLPLGDAGLLIGLDLAYRARRGDEVAAELLTAFRVTIKDADGKSYWPRTGGD